MATLVFLVIPLHKNPTMFSWVPLKKGCVLLLVVGVAEAQQPGSSGSPDWPEAMGQSRARLCSEFPAGSEVLCRWGSRLPGAGAPVERHAGARARAFEPGGWADGAGQTLRDMVLDFIAVAYGNGDLPLDWYLFSLGQQGLSPR